MKGRHHNIKLIVNYQNYKTSPFLYCNDTINQVNFVTSTYKKNSLALVLTTSAL